MSAFSWETRFGLVEGNLMTRFFQTNTRTFLLTVLAIGFSSAPGLGADTTQSLSMPMSGPPVCATVGTGITNVTLTVIGIPPGHIVTLAVDSYAIPAADAKNLGFADKALATTQTFTYPEDNTHYYVFTLTDTATNKSLKWKCGFDDTLSLSVGTLFTEIPYRTYTPQNVPGAMGVQNLLVVSENGRWTPQGVGLLNYKLFNMDKGLQLGLSASSGPVFKFGGTPGVSSFGWFAGASVSIWHRLFLTPGLHVGEFADYPAGFGNNTVVPANFGTPTPEKRWTGRFAFSITYRTNSLVKSSSGSTPAASTTPAPAAKPAPDAPAPAPAPANE
jgi:hypothetical protein